MKIEAGKSYKARNGWKVGPMEPYDDCDYPFTFKRNLWSKNGKRAYSEGFEDPTDIISEWTDTPDEGWSEWFDDGWGCVDTATHDFEARCIGGIHSYRTRPRKPKVETVTLIGGNERTGIFAFSTGGPLDGDTHLIAFNLIDGKPDPSSIRMEEL